MGSDDIVRQSSLLHSEFGFFAYHRQYFGRTYRTESEAVMAGRLSEIRHFEHTDSEGIERLLLGSYFGERSFIILGPGWASGYTYRCDNLTLDEFFVHGPRVGDFNVNSRGGIILYVPDVGRMTVATLPALEPVYLALLVPNRTARDRLKPGSVVVGRALATYFYATIMSMGNVSTDVENFFGININDFNPAHFCSF